MIVLGIDAGGSSSRWLLRNNDIELARAKTKSISGLFYDESNNTNLDNLNNLLEDVSKIAKPDAVLAGITGFTKDSLASKKMTKLIAEKFNISQTKVKLENDMYIAYRNAFKPGEGVLIYAGTGSIAYYQSRQKILRAGGRGYLIDDAGAGFWIGKEAIKQVLRQEDLGKTPKNLLAKEVYAALATKEWPLIKKQIYLAGRKGVAGFAPVVASAANKGDDFAIKILENAGKELARLANAVLRQLENYEKVVFSGGIAKLSPILTDSLRQDLPLDIVFSVITTEEVEAAARLALEL